MEPDVTKFEDRKDWGDATIAAFFMLLGPLVILALWLTPDLAPLWVKALATLMFALCMPFLAKMVWTARSRTIVLSNDLSLSLRAPFRRDHRTLPLDDIAAITFLTTDNDGLWYQAQLEFRDHTPVVFAQGSVYEEVQGKYQTMASALRARGVSFDMRDAKG